MCKCKLKVFFLSVITLSLILLVTDVSYGCGPCVNSTQNCGGLGGGMGTCSWNEGACEGNCPRYCGKGSLNQYCVGLWVMGEFI